MRCCVLLVEWSVEGRAAFSPYARSMLSLERSWQGLSYPQVSWHSPAQYLRYGWIRTEVSAGQGELSVRLHHRVHHGWDVEQVEFPEAVTWDEDSGRWRFARSELAVASRVAFVARGLRVTCSDGGSYTDRYLEAELFPGMEVEATWVSDDPAAEHTAPLLELGWSLSI
ncbi:MAG: hypothetical protein R6U88_02955 [Candidatus Bipolaricaulota bacterium]